MRNVVVFASTIAAWTAVPEVFASPAAEIDACVRSAAVVQARLNEEPPMRDEAYTAVMLSQLAADKAKSAGDVGGCVGALEVARLILRLPPAPSIEANGR